MTDSKRDIKQSELEFVNSYILDSSSSYILVDQDAKVVDFRLTNLAKDEIDKLQLTSIKQILPDINLSLIADVIDSVSSFEMKADLFLFNDVIPVMLNLKRLPDKNYYLFTFNMTTSSPSGNYNNCSEVVNFITRTINNTSEFDDIIDVVLEKLNKLVSNDCIAILFIDEYDLNVRYRSNNSSVCPSKSKLEVKSNTFLAQFIRLKSPIVLDGCGKNLINDLLNDSLVQQLVFAPMVINNSFFGAICLFNAEKKEYALNTFLLLELFASVIGNALKGSELNKVFKMQLRILKENIIERTKAFELIRSQNEKILEADLMKNEFIAHMSHELRTPLNSIIGFSEVLKLGLFGELTDKQFDYINDIHISGLYLLGMINDMLDLSKIEAKKMELKLIKFSIDQTIFEVLNILKPLAEKKNIEIIYTRNHTEDLIYADNRKFHQIMFNLLSNAIKFSHDNDQILLETQNASLDSVQAVLVKVIDHGIGVSEEHKEKIFKKFEQVDNKYTRSQGGSGLGLTITKELVEMHKGEIYLESELNKGSVFSFKLPIQCKSMK